MGSIGFREILIILLIILILFGAKRIPELARSLGRGIGEFKSGLKDQSQSPDSQKKDDEAKKG